jgi:hypothetical protein
MPYVYKKAILSTVTARTFDPWRVSPEHEYPRYTASVTDFGALCDYEMIMDCMISWRPDFMRSLVVAEFMLMPNKYSPLTLGHKVIDRGRMQIECVAMAGVDVLVNDVEYSGKRWICNEDKL